MAESDSKYELISRKEALAVGSKFYFTGRACKRGHVVRRYSNNLTCEVCAKLSAVASQKRDPEKTKATNKRSRRKNYLKNRERLLERTKRWQRANPERPRQYAKNRYNRDPEKMRVRSRKWYADNKSIAAAMARSWRERFPDRIRAIVQNRRARKKLAAGSYTAADITEIYKLQGGKCAYCRVTFVGKEYEVDHIIPLIKGGSNFRNNLQLVCQPCNNKKHIRDPIDHARHLGLLL